MSVQDKAFMGLVRVLPRQWLTMGAGKLASLAVPEALRTPVYGTFARLVGANVDEAAAGLTTFPTFNAFFTRALQDGLRPWNVGERDWGMPADGRLSINGRVAQGEMIQAKGIAYDVGALLGEDSSAWEGARYSVVYLSPADYHRVHWPIGGVVEDVRALGAELWPVNGPSVRSVGGLFVENERTVTIFRDSAGRRSAMVMVAATVVGGIELCVPAASSAHPVAVQGGDEHGRFYLGSTVVMVVQDANAPLTSADVALDSKVCVGEALWMDA